MCLLMSSTSALPKIGEDATRPEVVVPSPNLLFFVIVIVLVVGVVAVVVIVVVTATKSCEGTPDCWVSRIILQNNLFC